MRVPHRDQPPAHCTAGAFDGLDLLFNNAGIIEMTLTQETAVDTLPEDIWDAASGQPNGRRPVRRRPRRRRPGRRVLVGSSLGALVALELARRVRADALVLIAAGTWSRGLNDDEHERGVRRRPADPGLDA